MRAIVLCLSAAIFLTANMVSAQTPLKKTNAASKVTANETAPASTKLKEESIIATPASDFQTKTIGDGIEISGYNGFARKVVIPKTIDGKPVTSIGSSAFWDKKMLTEVHIPKSVQKIGSRAFGVCVNLSSVNIAAGGLREIEYDAFSGCGLKTIVLPTGLRTLGDHVFSGCDKLNSVSLPTSVTYFGKEVFVNCKSLKSFRFPQDSKIETFESNLFNTCLSLESVELPENLTEIPEGMFLHCKSLKKIKIPDGVTAIGRRAFENCPLTEISLPEGVTSIGYDAFCKTNITAFVVPLGVKKLESGSFTPDTKGQAWSVTIHPGVTYVDSGALTFSNRAKLTIYGQPETAAEDYASRNKIKFVPKAFSPPKAKPEQKVSAVTAKKQNKTVRKEEAKSANISWIVDNNRTCWLYDSVTGKIQPLRGMLPGVRDLYNNISPDNKYLSTTESRPRYSVFLYEILTGKLIRRFKIRSQNRTAATEFSPDSQWLAVRSEERDMLYRISTNEIVREVYQFKKFVNNKLYYWGKGTSLCDIESGNSVLECKSSPVSISPDEKIVACYAGQIYDMKTRQLIRNDNKKYYTSEGQFSPDGKFILAEYYDKEEGGKFLGLFDSLTGDLTHKINGENPMFSPDGKKLAVWYSNNNFNSRLYDTATGQRIEQFKGSGAYRHVLSPNTEKFLQILENLYGKERVQQEFEDMRSGSVGTSGIQISFFGNRGGDFKGYTMEFSYNANRDLVNVNGLGYNRITMPSSSVQKYLLAFQDYNKLFTQQAEQVEKLIAKEQDEED